MGKRHETHTPKATGHYLRDWRKWRGLTQTKLSELSGVTRPTVTRLENGKVRYNQDQLELLSAALGTKPWHLIAIDPTDLDCLQVTVVQAKKPMEMYFG
jgi:transcriptional regulator with XRE-family HTH domain